MHHISGTMYPKALRQRVHLIAFIVVAFLSSCAQKTPNVVQAAAKPQTLGPANKESFQEQLSQYREELGQCYLFQLKQDPQSRGRILLEVGVSSEGKIDGLKMLEDSIESQTLESCVLGRAAQWSFNPAPAEAILLHIPLDFEASFIEDEDSTP